MDKNDNNGMTPAQERLAALSRQRQRQTGNEHASYTNFVRRMRLILPLVAVAIIAALFTWPTQEKDIAILKEEQKAALKDVRKNELSSPKFESVDDKNQPFTITADKAVQEGEENDILLLDSPVGTITLDSGSNVGIEALEGTYWQTDEKLFLKNNVKLIHDDGYEMDMAELHIDLATRTAHSDTDVKGHGPAGTLQAKGLKGNNETNVLIFNGPAKLVLYDSGSLNGLGKGKENSTDEN